MLYGSPPSAPLGTQVVYHHDYIHSIRGKVAPTTKTVDLDRALHAYKLQSEVSSANLTKYLAEILDTAFKARPLATVEATSAWASSQPDLVDCKCCPILSMLFRSQEFKKQQQRKPRAQPVFPLGW